MEWVGHSLGNYEIEAEISRGGVASVYRAYQPQLDRWVAVKVIREAGAADPSFRDSFRREAKAIAALRHPNILSVYDYGEEEGMAYIVMEYVPGGTLKDVLTDRPMTWAAVALFIIPLARALAYAHAREIIHCDIKPGNVLLPRPDWPLLADFGLFKRLNVPQEDNESRGMSGTPAYAAPEQLRGQQLDQRTDVYGLALVAYELLAGRPPFSDPDRGTDIVARLQRPPRPVSNFNPAVNTHLEAAIMRALAVNPANRHADMQAFLNALLVADESSAVAVGGSAVFETGILQANLQHDGPHLVVGGTETILPLPEQDQVLLGRKHPELARQPDVDLEPYGAHRAGVSRLHARLVLEGEQWHLEDLNSTNGTTLNTAPLRPGEQRPIRSGDMIRCGRLMLIFYGQP